MDVNVRDVDEIIRFGRSLNGFLTDYLGSLQGVYTGAVSDSMTAGNALATLRSKAEKAERELYVAEWNLESTEEWAYRNPEKDYTVQIIHRQEMLEEKKEIYERARQNLEEGEILVKRIKINSDRVIEEVNRGLRQLKDQGHETLNTIKKAAAAISRYVK